jgi:hypothetical protein
VLTHRLFFLVAVQIFPLFLKNLENHLRVEKGDQTKIGNPVPLNIEMFTNLVLKENTKGRE